jgi:serine/threonine protein phosphatase PrpC
MSLSLRWGIRTDVGHVRPHNEDAAYAGPRLVVIADGMGGAVAGEVASRTVVDRLAALEDDDLGTDVVGALAAAVVGSNGDLGHLVADDPRLAGMGTTVTAMLADDDRLALVHVGDSRAYLFRDGVLTQVSRDHSLVQELVDAGEISEDEALVHPKRNIITRVLDGSGGLEPDVSVRTGKAGDRYLLCSDGLSDYVSHAAMTEAVAAPDPQQAADRLVELALAAGGVDNVTALVVDLVDARPLGGHTFVGASADEQSHDADLPPLPDEPTTVAGRSALGLGLHRRRQPEVDTARQRSRWLVPGVSLTVLVILAVALLGGWLYVRSQWYVGPDGNNVALYRGVPGSVGRVHLQSVQQVGPALGTLTPEVQRQVGQRITVDDQAAGERVLAEVERGTLPDNSAGNPAPSPTPTETSPPAGTPSLVPGTGTAT